MPPDPSARATLALGQAAVAAAVLDGTPPPAGFASDALALARHVVARKRAAPARRRGGRRLTRLRRSLVLSVIRFVGWFVGWFIVWLRAWLAPRR